LQGSLGETMMLEHRSLYKKQTTKITKEKTHEAHEVSLYFVKTLKPFVIKNKKNE